MTAQTNLDLVWAKNGGVTDPGDVKFENGWIAEIPTFQNFNFVLNTISKNLLALAEKSRWDWQTEIDYWAGAEVEEAGRTYRCILQHSGQQPSLDTAQTYWVRGVAYGDVAETALDGKHGIYLKDINKRTATGLWQGNDITIDNNNAIISLITSNGSLANLLIGNVAGELVVVDVGNTTLPDDRDISLSATDTHRIFHEGHLPDYTEVVGAIPDAAGSIATDGKFYARKNAGWVEITTTTVSTSPPPPVKGLGQGWFNLDDGQLYIDIDDGDSSQWVPANPPATPQTYNASEISYDNSTSGLTATNMQDAIDELAALHP